MAQGLCPVCKGFGKAHPVVDGKTDYSSLVFCVCRGDKALKDIAPGWFQVLEELGLDWPEICRF